MAFVVLICCVVGDGYRAQKRSFHHPNTGDGKTFSLLRGGKGLLAVELAVEANVEDLGVVLALFLGGGDE